MFGGFALQAIGLESTTASRSAFLLYLNVKLVPLLSSTLNQTPVAKATWISALTAFCGTALLSFDGSPPNAGDGWSVLAALTSAFFILRLQEASAQCAGQGRSLNAVTLLVVMLLCALWCAAVALARTGGDPLASIGTLHAELGALVERDWLPLIYLGAVCTGLCNWVQTVGQRSVRAEEAAIVYSTDPLWAASFSWLALGERLGPRGWGGAALILAAAVSTQVLAIKAIPEAAERPSSPPKAEGHAELDVPDAPSTTAARRRHAEDSARR
jgi:drug/metabolite transporter (DMT)-like permease